MGVYQAGDKWRVVIHRKGKRRDWILEGTKAEAMAFEARKRVELEVGAERIEMRVVPRLSDFIAESYLDHARVHLADKTMRDRQYTLATLEEHLGEMRLGDIDKVSVAAFQKTRLRAGLKASSVNDDVKVLLAVLNFAREELGYPLPPLKVKHLPRTGRRRNVTPWSREEVTRMLVATTAVSGDILPVIRTALMTGVRRGEAIALTWENVDASRKLLRIWPSEDWETKNREPREVPYSDAIAGYFDNEKATSKKWVFPCPTTRERYAFWPQAHASAVAARARSNFRCGQMHERPKKGAEKPKRCERCGAELLRPVVGGPHTLRHTFASHFLEKRPNLYLLGQVLGHSTGRVTELYGHLLPSHLEQARGVVEFALPRPLAVVRDDWGA